MAPSCGPPGGPAIRDVPDPVPEARPSPESSSWSRTMAARPRSPPSRLPGLPPDLVRLPHDGLVAGVSAGVARWLGVDPAVLRLSTLALALANDAAALA